MSRRKYTFQQRLEVVMHYFATDEGYRLTSARFNVPRTQVRICFLFELKRNLQYVQF